MVRSLLSHIVRPLGIGKPSTQPAAPARRDSEARDASRHAEDRQIDGIGPKTIFVDERRRDARARHRRLRGRPSIDMIDERCEDGRLPTAR